jgi:negative regulator of flagellin synthesis FlgM
MTISINDINKPAVHSSGQTTSTNKDASRSATENGNTPPGDTIVLTESARQIQQLEKQLGSIPVVDAEKVAEVRENLNSGNYLISSERIAEKFTRYESLLQQAS